MSMSASKLRFYILGTVVGWASAFVAARALVQIMSPGALACGRYMVASLVLAAPCLWGKRLPLPQVRHLPRFFLMGLCGFGAYNLMFNLGLQTIPAGTTALALNGTVVLTGLLGGFLVLGEQVPFRRWLAVCVILVGLTLIALGHGRLQADLGIVYVVMSGVLGGSYNLFQKSLLPVYDFQTCVTYSIWFGTLPLLWWAPEVVTVLPEMNLTVWFWLIFIGVVPGVLSYTWWGRILKELPASKASPLIATVPPVVIVMGWIVLGELPSPVSFVGGMIVLAGVLWSSRVREASQEET